jgi:hypothetical protein
MSFFFGMRNEEMKAKKKKNYIVKIIFFLFL